ncbi:hypothetical protein [Nocardia sp. NPDC004260]
MRASALLLAGAMSSVVTLLATATATAEPANTISQDGVYLVGVDIVPGLWEAPGTSDPAYACDWRRLWKVEGDNTNMQYIIANNYTRLGPVRVRIKPTDVGFKTENCGPWRLLSTAPPTGSSGD